MNTLYKILFSLLFIFPLCMASCTDENNAELDKGNQPLALKASENTIALDVSLPENIALTFDWTSGSNQGTNAAITYLFQLDLKGGNFENGVTLDLGRDIRTKSYKTDELNELLLTKFGKQANEAVEIDVRITANISSTSVQPEVSNIISCKVTTYKPVTKTLFLIGGAAPNGWSADNASPMNKVTGVAGGFTWQGRLNVGELKFITTLGQFSPSYGKGEGDNTLYFRESDSDPSDNKFNITKGGTYKITLNLITLAIHFEEMEGPEYTQLWFVGNPTGWSFKPMTVDPLDPFVFHYNADLSAGGDFKIGTQASFDDNVVFLRPEVNETPAGTDLNVVKWSKNENSADNKWKIAGGVYKIKLDTREKKIDIVPFTPYAMIYFVGSATSAGWDVGNAVPMTMGGDPYKFTWTGTLNEGELKFSCDKQTDWNGAWFIATEADMAPSGQLQQMIFSAKGSGPDNKWKITDAGTYTIELNQLLETITITKN